MDTHRLRRRPRRASVRSFDDLPEAGELLAVEALDRTGLLVRSDGAFVRVLRVTPANPLMLSDEDRQHVADGFGRLLARLRPGQSIQFYLEARPVRLEDLVARLHEQVWRSAGAPDRPGDATAAARWRLFGAIERSLRAHADAQAAIDLRAYAIVPHHPRRRGLRAQLARTASAPLTRDLDTHRRAARDSQAHVDALRSELEACDLAVQQLDGASVFDLLWQRLNPTSADSARPWRPAGIEVLGELDAVHDRTRARAAADALRTALARSSIDLTGGRHLIGVERDLEQVVYAHTTAQQTSMGWLLGAMLTRQPFTLSVHVRALDRRRERQKLKLGYRRLYTINRGAEHRGRVPDFDRYVQEAEHQRLLTEMAGQERANLFEVSIYQSLRARGPEPDQVALAEAVDHCVEAIESTVDCRVGRGEFRQLELWSSTLPLGRDVARRVRKYATRNAADSVPLIGTGCGSPDGIPFAFTDPGRTLELLDPYDPDHANHTMLICGRSGSGKTLAANVILGRMIACGARAFAIDRAGHYEMLTRLVDGAQQIELGAGHSPYAINPWDVPDPREVSREKIAFLLSLHALMMGDEGLDKTETAQLGEAIRAVYARAATLEQARPRESMLRDELLAMATHHQREGAAELAALVRNLATRLSEWCGEGTYAYLLDRETTVGADSPFVVFDTRRCPQEVLRPVMFSIMEFVTSTVERHWKAHMAAPSRPDAPRFAGRSVFVIDEGWHVVGRHTGEYANDLALRARHFGMFLIGIFQQLTQVNTEHGRALLQNSTIQLLLAQQPSALDFMQSALDMSREQRDQVGRLRTVKGEYAQMVWINGSRGRSRVALRVGPEEYWAYTSDQARDVPRREAALRAADGDPWQALHALASPTPVAGTTA